MINKMWVHRETRVWLRERENRQIGCGATFSSHCCNFPLRCPKTVSLWCESLVWTGLQREVNLPTTVSVYSNWLRVKVLHETENTTSFNSESTNWHLHSLKKSPGSNCDQEGLRSDVRLKNTEETNRHEQLSKNFLIGFYLSEFTISRLSRVQIPPPPEG